MIFVRFIDFFFYRTYKKREKEENGSGFFFGTFVAMYLLLLLLFPYMYIVSDILFLRTIHIPKIIGVILIVVIWLFVAAIYFLRQDKVMKFFDNYKPKYEIKQWYLGIFVSIVLPVWDIFIMVVIKKCLLDRYELHGIVEEAVTSWCHSF